MLFLSIVSYRIDCTCHYVAYDGSLCWTILIDDLLNQANHIQPKKFIDNPVSIESYKLKMLRE